MPYIKDGFIHDGYYEGDATTITPSDKILNITYSFVLDGVDITEFVESSDIIRENGKAFTTLSMKLSGYIIDTTYIRNKDIRLVVTIGTSTYSFILYDVDKDFKGDYNIIGKTQGCLLDEPFSTKVNDTIFGSANDIITTLTSNISSYNSLPNFEFNEGSFALEGSPLDGLEQLIAVSGGTMFEINDHLILTPHFYIESDTPRFILNNDVLFSKVLSDNFSGSSLAKEVIFNASEADLLSEPLITLVSEENCLRPYFLFNPIPSNISSISSNLGDMVLTFINQTYKEIIDSNNISVSGGIISITQITLDGVPIDESDYQYVQNYNTILFTSTKKGTITVSYLTKGIKLYERNGIFDISTRSVYYTMQYLTQTLDANVPMCAEMIESDGLNNFSISLVGSGILMDTPTQFDVIGTVNNVAFVSDPSSVPTVVNGYYAYGNFDTTFMETISIEQDLVVDKTLTSTFENVTDNITNSVEPLFGFFTSPDIEIGETMIGSLVLNLEKDDTNPLYNIYYTTNSTFLGISSTSTYSAIVDRYTIPSVGIGNTVKYIDFYYDNGVSSFSYPDLTDGTYAGLCVLPATILLDIASLLDLYPQTVSGGTITYNGVPSLIAPNGKTTIIATTATKIIIDTAHLRKGSFITVDTSNAEV